MYKDIFLNEMVQYKIYFEFSFQCHNSKKTTSFDTSIMVELLGICESLIFFFNY